MLQFPAKSPLLASVVEFVAVGSSTEVDDNRYREWNGKKFYGQPLEDIVGLMRAATAVVSIDCGIRHLAAAVGANLFCISGAIPLHVIRCFTINEDQRIHEVFKPLIAVNAGVLVRGLREVI